VLHKATGTADLGSRPRALLLAAFFVSGAASLIFEVVWTRLLLISLGATATAVGIVLGAFMGGMAVGSAWAARGWMSRRDPILLFAILEGWVGAYGLLTPYLLRSLTTASPALQFIVALVILLPSTIAMGASLPVLTRALANESDVPAAEVGKLYAANTAGAVAGPLISVFWLFPWLGLSRTLMIASVADFLIFGGLILARRGFPTWKSVKKGASEEPGRPEVGLLVALGVSGATAMAYEVAWTRTLSLVFGSSVYGVTIMLSTFLFGIAAGSALAASWIRRRRKAVSLKAPAWLLAGSSLGAFASLIIARALPFLFVNIYRSFPERDLSLFLTQFVVSVLLMLPSTLCLGAMLPIATGISTTSDRRTELGRQVSHLYTANLVGSTAGAIITATLLMGRFGIELSVRSACLLSLVVALFLLAKARTPRVSTAGLATISGALLFILGVDPSGEPVAKGFGFYTEPSAYDRYDSSGLRELVAAHRLLYYRDGPTATVSVQMVDRYLFLKINGKTDASNGPGDTDTQLLLGHLPLLAADADKVAIIGWGSGMTAGAVLSHDVEKVDAFEIEPAVVEASHFFDSINGNPLQDSRLQLILGDARSRLLRTDETYDLIISEPSNPWITGVANLFTKDFFELAASRLQPEGILAQWFHLYGMSEASTRSLLATFGSVFPHTLVFKDRDLILLGSRKPIGFDVTRMEAMFNSPRIKESLSGSMARYPFDILADLRLDENGLSAYTKDVRLNTDDNLLLELAAPRSLYKDHIESIRAGMARHSAIVLDHVTGYASRAEAYLELASSYYTSGRKDEAFATCKESLAMETSFEGLKLLGIILENLGRGNEAREALEKALALGGDPQGRRFVEALIRSLDSPVSP
jgi:spermidine synthase